MKVMINKIIRKKNGKFQSGSFGKKNMLIALSLGHVNIITSPILESHIYKL